MATEMKVTFVGHYVRMQETLIAEHPAYFRKTIENLYLKAVGYGWGRIDAPGVKWPEHGGDALDFATAYAIHNMTPGATHALREAYDAWYTKGEIA